MADGDVVELQGEAMEESDEETQDAVLAVHPPSSAAESAMTTMAQPSQQQQQQQPQQQQQSPLDLQPPQQQIQQQQQQPQQQQSPSASTSGPAPPPQEVYLISPNIDPSAAARIAQARFDLYQQTNGQYARTFRTIQHNVKLIHTSLGEVVGLAQETSRRFRAAAEDAAALRHMVDTLGMQFFFLRPQADAEATEQHSA